LDLAGKMLEKEQEDFTKNSEINQDKIFGKLAQVVKNVHK